MPDNSFQCDSCTYYTYDDYTQQYFCDVNMDEDDAIRMAGSHFKGCPYYSDGDEYKLAHKQ